jgi:hypothetical protein
MNRDGGSPSLEAAYGYATPVRGRSEGFVRTLPLQGRRFRLVVTRSTDVAADRAAAFPAGGRS